MTQINSSAPPFRKTLLLTLLMLLVGLPLFGQNQYWQYEFGVTSIGNSSRGQLSLHEFGVTVNTGRDIKTITGLGRSLGSSFATGSGVVDIVEYIEEREDLILVFSYQGLNDGIEVKGFDKESMQTLFTQSLGDISGSNDLGFVVVKGDGDNYFCFSNTTAYKLSNPSVNGIDIDYQIDIDGSDITDGCYLDGKVYTCDKAGTIRIFDSFVSLASLDIGDVELYGISPSNDGLVATGIKDGQASLISLGLDGEINWTKEYNHERGTEVIQGEDGEFLITGINDDNTGFFIKANSTGDLLWESNLLNYPGTQVLESELGAIYVLSRESNSPTTYELLKFGPNGEVGPNIEAQVAFPLSVNNIEASISPQGLLFWDGSDAQYFFPSGSQTATFFAAQLWMGGRDESGTIHLAADQYFPNGDYQMGPIGTDPSFFERVWSITQEEISIIQADLSDGEKDLDWSIDYLQWPAKGNTLYNANGEALELTESYAPFIDVDADGNYDPLAGDYPDIKGEQMLWWIFNDSKTNTPNTSADVFHAEVIGSLYAKGCNSGFVGYNTSYLDFEITNKSTDNYPEFSLGFWADPDLGCYTDDYIGSLPSQNAAYVYNEDAVDGQLGNTCPGGVTSFGSDVPIQSIVFLNQTMDNFSYFENPSVGVPPPATTDPGNSQEFLHYMNGKWRDGTPITEGGSGYNPASSDVISHVFPGEPSNSGAWSLCSAALGEGDRRIIMSSHFQDFKPNDRIDLHMAFITSVGSVLPCPNLDIVKADIEAIQNIYDQDGASYVLDLGAATQDLLPGSSLMLDAGAGAASYNWSTGEMTQSIEVFSTGVYSVTVSDHYGCESMDEVLVQMPNSLVQQDNPHNVSLFPNPAEDRFIILSDDAFEAIDIHYAGGQLVKSFQGENLLSGNEISIGDLAAGMYWVSITFADGVYTDKLIVH